MIERFRKIVGRRAGYGEAGTARAGSRRARSRGAWGVERLEGRLLLSGDPPTAVDDAYSTAAGTPLTIAAAGVLANDHAAPGSTRAISPADALASWTRVISPYAPPAG